MVKTETNQHVQHYGIGEINHGTSTTEYDTITQKDPVYLGGKIIVIKSAGSRIIQTGFKFYFFLTQVV